MEQSAIQAAVEDISSEGDPSLKMLKLASICSALWRERGVELVVVGGSAIELLTDGAYVSGDLDLYPRLRSASVARAAGDYGPPWCYRWTQELGGCRRLC